MKDLNLFKSEDSIFLKRLKSKAEVLKDDVCDGYLIDSSEKEARRIVESLKKSKMKIAVVGGDDVFNRRVIETLKVDYLVSPEAGDGKDTLKQRDSGINHVVAKLAKAKSIAIVVDFCEVRKLSGKAKALRLEKIIQNVKICRKAGCEIKIASLASVKKDVVDELGRKSFGVSLGMSSVQSAGAVRF
jgi:RNase P/RNase MRP subunit p30